MFDKCAHIRMVSTRRARVGHDRHAAPTCGRRQDGPCPTRPRTSADPSAWSAPSTASPTTSGRAVAAARLDPRPRGRPPGAQRRGPGRRADGIVDGEPVADVRAPRRPATPTSTSSPRRRPRSSGTAPGRRHRPRRRARRRCPTTTWRRRIERTPGGRTFPAARRSPRCGCARSRSTTPTWAPATPADWPPSSRRCCSTRWLKRGAAADAVPGRTPPTWTAPGVRRAAARPSPARRRPRLVADRPRDGEGLTSDSGVLPQDRRHGDATPET